LPFLVSSLTLCASPACGIQGRGHIVTIVIYSYNSSYSGTETPLLALPENGGFNHGRIFFRSPMWIGSFDGTMERVDLSQVQGPENIHRSESEWNRRILTQSQGPHLSINLSSTLATYQAS
jgi:hypothetical protein